MHILDLKKNDLRTDLVMDNNIKSEKVYSEQGVELYNSSLNNYHYSTITFIDSTDKDQKRVIESILTKELKKYIDKDKVLIIGLGNRKSTPDALGPKSLDQILVTRHLFSIGDVEGGYSNVAIFEPSVFGQTGISSVELIKKVVDIVKPDSCIIIDSLCTSNSNRLNKTIQITDKGINPGSGVFNDRGELSSDTLNCRVVAIGVPTVVDMDALIKNTLGEKLEENIEVEDNLIVTPKEIDYLIESLSFIIGDSINKALHVLNRQEATMD